LKPTYPCVKKPSPEDHDAFPAIFYSLADFQELWLHFLGGSEEVGAGVKKITSSTFKKDKYYKKITKAVHEILTEGSVVMPVDLFIRLGNLTREDYENWRFGRIPYLERVITGNLSKINRKLRILHLHALDRGLKPSQTVYKKWGKGRKVLLRFSKHGSPALESAYSRHYVAGPRKREKEADGPVSS
jgi:hypothetical protein